MWIKPFLRPEVDQGAYFAALRTVMFDTMRRLFPNPSGLLFGYTSSPEWLKTRRQAVENAIGRFCVIEATMLVPAHLMNSQHLQIKRACTAAEQSPAGARDLPELMAWCRYRKDFVPTHHRAPLTRLLYPEQS
jgi:hypothetical protein